MKSIIIVERKNKYEFSDKKEAIEQFLGQDYYSLSEEEQYKKVKLRTLMNSTLKGIPAKDIKKGDTIEDIEKKQYIILDEETFLLSLAKNNDIVIYEQENANEFAIDIDKSELERVSEQYIRINDCVNQILQRKLQNLNLGENMKGKYEGEKGI